MNKVRGKLWGPLMPVDRPRFLELYHVSWAYSKGVVGRCVAINENNKTVTLRSPKTKIDWKIPVKWSDLRYTRKAEFKIKSFTSTTPSKHQQ